MLNMYIQKISKINIPCKVSNLKVKNIDTKQSNKRNNQNSKDKRQDYNMK